MLRDLLLRNRSYRRFQQQPLDEQTLVEHLEALLAVALGRPGETVVLQDGSPDQRPYRRDADNVHHVPKRPLAEVRVELPGF